MKARLLGCLLAAVLFAGIPRETLAAESTFLDVPQDAGYAEAVTWCKEQGIMSGVSDTAFSPDGKLTRAMLAATLYQAAGSPAVSGAPAFTDTQAGTWYANAVAWANSTGLVAGYGNGRFGTDDPITREQLATILWRYDGGKTAQQVQISDWDDVSGYAVSAVNWAVGAGVMASRSGSVFAPKEAATRAEAASALYANFNQNKEESTTNKITLSFSGHSYTATLAENSSAEALKELLKHGPLTIDMSDYANMEKVGPIGQSLPTNNQQITTQAGDLILYQGNSFVIYYASNSWNFTRLGRIDDPSGLRSALGSGNVRVTLTLG